MGYFFRESGIGPGKGSRTAAPESYVSERFEWLRKLVRGTKDRPAPIDGVQKELDALATHLKSVSAAMDSGLPVLPAGGADQVRAAKEAAAQLPPQVGGMIAALAQDSATLVAGGARARLNNLWTSKVLPFCQEAIHDRYPFARGSKRDTTLTDFARLFGPAGLLDTFFSENLQALVDSSRAKWTWVNGGIGIPDSVLAQFQRAALIREAFFAGGGKLPAASFELTPIVMDARATQLTLDLGGPNPGLPAGTPEDPGVPVAGPGWHRTGALRVYRD